jgi:hypothetical protein
MATFSCGRDCGPLRRARLSHVLTQAAPVSGQRSKPSLAARLLYSHTPDAFETFGAVYNSPAVAPAPILLSCDAVTKAHGAAPWSSTKPP